MPPLSPTSSPHPLRGSRPSVDTRSSLKPHPSSAPLTPPLTPANYLPVDSDGDEDDGSQSSPSICTVDTETSAWSPTTPASSFPSALDSDLNYTTDQTKPLPETCSRFLHLSGVPRDAPIHTIQSKLATLGEIKAIYVDLLTTHGVVILAFWDIRHSLHIHHAILSSSTSENILDFAHPSIEHSNLVIRFIQLPELVNLIGPSSFLDDSCADLPIVLSPVNQHAMTHYPEMRSISHALNHFGEVMYLTFTGVDVPHGLLNFHVDFFDSRASHLLLSVGSTLATHDALPGWTISPQHHISRSPRDLPRIASPSPEAITIPSSPPPPLLLDRRSPVSVNGRRSSTGSSSFIPGELTPLQQSLNAARRAQISPRANSPSPVFFEEDAPHHEIPAPDARDSDSRPQRNRLENKPLRGRHLLLTKTAPSTPTRNYESYLFLQDDVSAFFHNPDVSFAVAHDASQDSLGLHLEREASSKQDHLAPAELTWSPQTHVLPLLGIEQREVFYATPPQPFYEEFTPANIYFPFAGPHAEALPPPPPPSPFFPLHGHISSAGAALGFMPPPTFNGFSVPPLPFPHFAPGAPYPFSPMLAHSFPPPPLHADSPHALNPAANEFMPSSILNAFPPGPPPTPSSELITPAPTTKANSSNEEKDTSILLAHVNNPRRMGNATSTSPLSGMATFSSSFNPVVGPRLSSPNNHYTVPSSPYTSLRTGATRNGGGDGSIPERNRIDVERIEEGLDTRTTIMLKNVPNKMSAAELEAFIGSVVERAVDFLYLRIDFSNSCNVGYAFVNFIEIDDLLMFCKTKLGHKWNMFHSEKVIQASYANYQGKAALVDKFRNSAVLDQRREWHPHLFHSDGPEKGLPHEFPPPNSTVRHERSLQIKNAGIFHPRQHHMENRVHHHPAFLRQASITPSPTLS